MYEKSFSDKYVTCTKTAIWLIGQAQPELPGNVLPTAGEVLQTFFYHHHVCKKTVSESANSTANAA